MKFFQYHQRVHRRPAVKDYSKFSSFQENSVVSNVSHPAVAAEIKTSDSTAISAEATSQQQSNTQQRTQSATQPVKSAPVDQATHQHIVAAVAANSETTETNLNFQPTAVSTGNARACAVNFSYYCTWPFS